MFASGHGAAVHLVAVLIQILVDHLDECDQQLPFTFGQTSALLIAYLPRQFSREKIWIAILHAIGDVSYGSKAKPQRVCGTSVLPPRTDITHHARHVRKVPITDISLGEHAAFGWSWLLQDMR
jgi:hypothetical protein